jgi:hypothetical protein
MIMMNKWLDLLYGAVIMALTLVLFFRREQLRIKNFVSGGFLGAMTSLRVLIYYSVAMCRDKQYRGPPHDALFAKSLFDFLYGILFVAQGLDDRLLSRPTPNNKPTQENYGSLCTGYAMALQFLFIAGELCFALAMIDLYKSLKNPFKSNSIGKRLRYYNRVIIIAAGVTLLMAIVPSNDIEGKNPYGFFPSMDTPMSGAYGYTSRCFCGPRWQTDGYYNALADSTSICKNATCYYTRTDKFCNVLDSRTSSNGTGNWDRLTFYRVILWYLWIFVAAMLGLGIYLWAFDRLRGGVSATFATRLAIIKATNTNVVAFTLFWWLWFSVYVILPSVSSNLSKSKFFPGECCSSVLSGDWSSRVAAAC